jgi:uncharacterized protein
VTLPDFITVVPVDPIVSPCVNVCRIGRDRRCEGCRRTVAEIAGWTGMTPAERDRIMAELPGR